MKRHTERLPDVLLAAETTCTARELGAELEIASGHAGFVLRYWERRGMLAATFEPVPMSSGSGSRQTCKRYRLTDAGRVALATHRGARPDQHEAAHALAAALGYSIQ